MRLLEALGLQRPAVEAAAEGAVLAPGQLASIEHELEVAKEKLADLQREDRGWESLTHRYAADISREGLGRNADLVRVMSIMNPLLKRGKTIRAGYVFGQGVEVTAREVEDGQDVDAVAQAFLTDEGNAAAVFGAQARTATEHDLFDDGNVFIAHFTNPLDGRVQVRPIPFDEVVEIVTAPGDRFTPWYYKRVWSETTPTETFGTGLTRQRTAYYPDLHFQPLTKPKALGGHEVMWDAPVYHLKVNPVGRDRIWGVGDGFAATPRARAYKEFLEDWSLLMKALSRIAWLVKDKTSKAQGLRAAVQSAAGGQAGGFAYTGNAELEAPSKSGATIDAESGRPIAAMTAAALGVTVTILLADPGQTGARAVAETLDQPMRLEMGHRQDVHAEFYKASAGYAIEQAVIAPRGPLKGRVERDGDRLLVRLDDDQPPTIEVSFPDLEEFDMKTLMESIEIADGQDVLPPLVRLRLVAQALKLRDLADLIDQVTDDDGEFVPPSTTVGDTAGTAAADALRAGGNPADTL